MRTGNNYTGARWAFSSRPRRKVHLRQPDHPDRALCGARSRHGNAPDARTTNLPDELLTVHWRDVTCGHCRKRGGVS